MLRDPDLGLVSFFPPVGGVLDATTIQVLLQPVQTWVKAKLVGAGGGGWEGGGEGYLILPRNTNC